MSNPCSGVRPERLRDGAVSNSPSSSKQPLRYEVFPYSVDRNGFRRSPYVGLPGISFSSASATVIDKENDRIFDCTATYDQLAKNAGRYGQDLPVKYSGSCRLLQLSSRSQGEPPFTSPGIILHNGNFQIKDIRANQNMNNGQPVVGIFWFIDQMSGRLEFCDLVSRDKCWIFDPLP